jgi:hypothetical protein
VCDCTFVENEVRIGDSATIKCGVHLWEDGRVETDVFIGPIATYTNDPFLRSKRRPAEFEQTVIKPGASIEVPRWARPTIAC